MPSLLALSLAVLASLQATIGLATPISVFDKKMEKRSGAYVNSVYFTNW